MSFILDALKKLEREKETRASGVVMVGPVQWGGPDRQRQRRRLVLATVGLVALAAGALLWLVLRPAPPTVPPPPPTATAAPAAPVDSAPLPTAAARPETVAPPPPRGLDLPGSPPARAPHVEASTAAAAEAEDDVGEEEVLADAARHRDATGPDEPAAETPPPVPPPNAPEYRLTAISERDGRPVALLNDRLVHEGDRFDNLRIIRIGPADVEIEVDGERRTIGF